MSVLAVPALAASLALAQLELRGERHASGEPVVGVGLQGVTVGEAPVLIPWAEVRSVGGEWAEEAERFLPYAEKAWRARSRLRRGDAIAAEPLLEELFHAYAWRRGPTSAMVAEGLLRARLRRGSQPGAVEPWLALLHARSGDLSFEQESPPVVDAATGLAPALPPIWLADPAVEAFGRDGLESAAEGPPHGDVAGLLLRWYRAAAAFEAGLEFELPEERSRHPGVVLVQEVVLSRAGDFEQRRTAREALRQRIDSAEGTWVEAWARAGLGRSLLGEAQDEQRRRGVLHLLHLPVRFSGEHPHLAGLALAEAAVALDELGDRRAAAALAADLRARYADHPALGWRRLRPLGPPGETLSRTTNDAPRGGPGQKGNP